jgi:multiple sugar transport system permease protein
MGCARRFAKRRIAPSSIQIQLPVAIHLRLAMVSALILVFVFSWNEFMLALTLINSEQAKTITLGVSTLSGALAYDIPPAFWPPA